MGRKLRSKNFGEHFLLVKFHSGKERILGSKNVLERKDMGSKNSGSKIFIFWGAKILFVMLCICSNFMKKSLTVLKLNSRHNFYTKLQTGRVLQKKNGRVTVLVHCKSSDDVLYL